MAGVPESTSIVASGPDLRCCWPVSGRGHRSAPRAPRPRAPRASPRSGRPDHPAGASPGPVLSVPHEGDSYIRVAHCSAAMVL
jgi:hypothetical protein